MAKKKTKGLFTFFILMGTTQPRAVALTLEKLVTFGENNPYFYDGEVLRYVEGESAPTSFGSFSSCQAQLKAAEKHD